MELYVMMGDVSINKASLFPGMMISAMREDTAAQISYMWAGAVNKCLGRGICEGLTSDARTEAPMDKMN